MARGRGGGARPAWASSPIRASRFQLSQAAPPVSRNWDPRSPPLGLLKRCLCVRTTMRARPHAHADSRACAHCRQAHNVEEAFVNTAKQILGKIQVWAAEGGCVKGCTTKGEKRENIGDITGDQGGGGREGGGRASEQTEMNGAVGRERESVYVPVRAIRARARLLPPSYRDSERSLHPRQRDTTLATRYDGAEACTLGSAIPARARLLRARPLRIETRKERHRQRETRTSASAPACGWRRRRRRRICGCRLASGFEERGRPAQGLQTTTRVCGALTMPHIVSKVGNGFGKRVLHSTLLTTVYTKGWAEGGIYAKRTAHEG